MLIVKTNGDIYALGNNGSGQLGLGHYDNVEIPTKIEGVHINY